MYSQTKIQDGIRQKYLYIYLDTYRNHQFMYINHEMLILQSSKTKKQRHQKPLFNIYHEQENSPANTHVYFPWRVPIKS